MFLMLSYVLFMKLVSFAMVCRDNRHAYWKGAPTPEVVEDLCGVPLVSYPQNLQWKSIYYFVAAPILVYQMNYPRTSKIRVYWLLGKIAQFVFLVFFIILLIEQFIVPTIQNTMVFMKPTPANIPYLITRLLKLSVCLFVLLCLSKDTKFSGVAPLLLHVLPSGPQYRCRNSLFWRYHHRVYRY